MNIYVGNLSFTVTEDDLRQAFQAFGAVEKAAIITDKMSGQPRPAGGGGLNLYPVTHKNV